MVGRVSSPQFVGRREELRELERALERTREGFGSAVLIGAEAGMGKSRLIAEFATSAREAGSTVLLGECLPLGDGELPFAPIAGALRSLVNELGLGAVRTLAGSARDDAARLLPDLVMADAAPSRRATVGSRSRLFDSLLSLLANAARAAPVVLVIEDLHWSDRSTRDFLAFLLRGTRAERVTLIVSYRSDELHRRHPVRAFLVELQRSGQAVRVELGRLTTAEVREQVGAIRGSAPDPALIGQLVRRAEGNPFFIEELLASAGTDGTALPASLRDALLMRVEGCTPPTRQVLYAAAVAGREVDHTLLEAVVSHGPDDLHASLREAVDSYLLASAAARYTFRHALLREAVYDDLLPGERRALHLRIASALSDRPELTRADAPRAAELAHHYYAAGALPEALASSLDAGIAAEGTYAFDEATLHYTRALEIWDAASGASRVPPLDRLEVLRRASEAAYLSGAPEAATELARETLDRLGRDDPVARSLAHERLGRYLWMAGRGDDALPEYRRAVELMPAAPPTAERAYVLASEAQALMLCGQNDASRTQCAEALEIARSLGARDVEANVLNTMIPNWSLAGDTDGAIDAMNRALAIASDLGLTREIGRSYVNGSDALDQAGRVQEGIDLARKGIDVCARFGAERDIGDFLRGDIAGRLLRIGAWDETETLLEELLEHEPHGNNAAIAYRHVGWLHAQRGEHEAASRAFDRADREASRAGGSMWSGPLGEAEAANQLWAGQPALAVEIVERSLALTADTELIFFTVGLYQLGARACADIALAAPADEDVRLTQSEAVAALLERLEHAIEQLSGKPQPRVLATREICVAERARIDRSGAEEAWATAERAWSACQDPYQVAYVNWRWAEAILAGGGERRDAETLARKACATAESLRVRPLLAELGALARRARFELFDDTGSPPAPNAALERLELTARETEVLALLADGMTNREIAARLFISGKTASVHVSRILSKLSVPNRAAAAAAAQHLGINPPPPGAPAVAERPAAS